MQTFLPYASFEKSVRCLDYKRLGKQRVEAHQISNQLRHKWAGWRNHPAVRMWAGYRLALLCYMNACIREWERRGYVNNKMKINRRADRLLRAGCVAMPPWLGRRSFHRSHQSNLLRKDRKHYRQFGWNVPSTLPYEWPVSSVN